MNYSRYAQPLWTLQYEPVYTEAMRLPRAWLDRFPLIRFVVADTSMRPTLSPGDRIVAVPYLRPRIGDVIVFRHPQQQRTVAVKRVTATTAGGDLVVSGDNPNVSTDSRHFGPLSRRLVIGRVVYRYGPPERRGRLSPLG